MTPCIRPALAAELDQLPLIENSAGEAFRGSSQDAVADGPDTPAAFYLPLTEQGLVWVAELGGQLIGFAACEAFDDALHLWELAVRKEHQKRGIGRALVDQAILAAQRLALPALTLSTFRDIPWNAPFYERLGFVELPPGAPYPRKAKIAELEAAHGLDVDNRCFMRLPISGDRRPGDDRGPG